MHKYMILLAALVACGASEGGTDAPVETTVSFALHVKPSLEATCLGGGCHSSPSAGGLWLETTCSEAYSQLTGLAQGFDGYRISSADVYDPAGSYLVQKATGSMGHSGGASLSGSGLEYVMTWIGEGFEPDC